MTNQQVATDFVKVILNGREYDRIEEFFHKDFINHMLGKPTLVGLENGFHNSIKQFLIAVPTAKFEVLKTIAEGDYVWTYAKVTGLPGDSAMMSVDILRFSEGKIIEKWDVQAQVPPSA